MTNKTKKELVPIKDILVDHRFYPRKSLTPDTDTIIRYKTARKLGALFPPITLADWYDKLYLVDGLHRLEGYIIDEKTNIPAIIHYGLDEKQINLLAINQNIRHGNPLTHSDLVYAGTKLERLGLTKNEISKIVGVRIEDLSRKTTMDGKALPYTMNQNNTVMSHSFTNYQTCPTCNGQGKITIGENKKVVA